MNYDYLKDRFGILRCFLFSALMPDHRFHLAANLDWSPRFMEREERRRINKQFEYQGSNIPINKERPIILAPVPLTRKQWKKALRGKAF